MSGIIEKIDNLIDTGDWGWRGANVYDIVNILDGEEIHDKVIGESRWQNIHSVVAKFGDEYVEFQESRGATEMQDSDPVEKGDYWLVEPKEVTVIKYVKVGQNG